MENFGQNMSGTPQNEGTSSGSFVFWFMAGVLLVVLAQEASGLLFGSSGQWGPVALGAFENNRFAFSLPVPEAVSFAIYGVILAAAAGYCFRHWRLFPSFERLAWTLVFAGAVSNVAERLVRGSVRDYVFFLGGIFNAADAYILCGVLLLCGAEIGARRVMKRP